MANENKYFPDKPEVNPRIYAYKLIGVPDHEGFLKIGETNQDVHDRIKQQTQTAGITYELVLDVSASKNDGNTIRDHEVRARLIEKGHQKLNPKIPNLGKEWLRCEKADIESTINEIKLGKTFETPRNLNFKMRPEQKQAVLETSNFFKNFIKLYPDNTPKFLWNAKMRFGKTFTTYQLAKEMKFKRVLVMTFKPAVENSWKEDLEGHIDFEGWQFYSKNTLFEYEDLDFDENIVCFGSFQDFLGKNPSTGGIKSKNKWVHKTDWDMVVFDEYHYGAWRENAKELFETDDNKEKSILLGEGLEYFDHDVLPIKSKSYLYLSGTPFRAISSGEFLEDQIFNWTYLDEQKMKKKYEDRAKNPYKALPKMLMMTYQLPDSMKEIAEQGQFNEFSLNRFFEAKGEGDDAKFIYEDEVQKWLELIQGNLKNEITQNLKLRKTPPMPFSHAPLKKALNHTVWVLPSVSSCFAMKNLLEQPNNIFYKDYEVICAAGTSAGIGIEALPPVRNAMEDPLNTKTITLTFSKLLTGVTVRPWSGIFMLRSVESPETYFQAVFRVQNAWTIPNPENVNEDIILKEVCYVFDFDPNRALRKIVDYSSRLSEGGTSTEQKVKEFLQFLPVLAYDGSFMQEIDAEGLIDMAMSGTTATLLARGWQSALLVNVDDFTLSNLLNNEEAMAVLTKIEDFRNLAEDLEIIINKSESIKKAKRDANDEEISKEKKKALSQEEKEVRSKRKVVQEKLQKFSTRIPVFMYLTDFRERALEDVITNLEPNLFKKVTGLTQSDFKLLKNCGVFNEPLMNDMVFKFKRYEDSSLIYTGINNQKEGSVGLFSTTISQEEYNKLLDEDKIIENIE